jgi:hypothetical protein
MTADKEVSIMKNGLQQELYKVTDEILKEYYTWLRIQQVGEDKAMEEIQDGHANWIEW